PQASQTRHPAECPTERGYLCSGKGAGATREQKPVGFGRCARTLNMRIPRRGKDPIARAPQSWREKRRPPKSIWREGTKTTAPGHAEGQKRGPPNTGEGSPHSPLWNMGVLGARPPRAPRIQFRREEGSGPQGPGVSSVPAGRPRLGGREKPTAGHRDSPAPPARPY
ncbi:hypothetical protein EI555_004535, partial [Monodon monoceros]